MAEIFLVDLEAVDTRYTGQWKTHVPTLLTDNGHNVTIIEGPTDIPAATTPGAFLNFGGTNIYKASQVEQIGRLFCNDAVPAGAHFIFTDAWHPGIINLKYMSELLKIPVTIHALWHAGSYDQHDFLGRLIGNTPWVRYAEKSFFYAIDHNYFATQFHINMFIDELLHNGFKAENPWYSEDCDELIASNKIVQTGWPMEYMAETLDAYKDLEKRELILFPHRVAPEKQVEIFRDLAIRLPQYEFIVCQDSHLSKHEYHTLLGQSKIVFSASLQETLGIGCYEGAIVNALPMVPARLSYKEMYMPEFKYPSIWTESFDAYIEHREDLCRAIVKFMNNYDSYIPTVKKQTDYLIQNFFSANKMLDLLKN